LSDASKANTGKWLTIAAIGTTVVLWASAFVAIRAALPGYRPEHLALLRFLVASAVLAIYALATRMRMPARSDLPRILLAGLVGITGYNLALNTSEQTVSAGSASLLVNTGPIWTALIAMVVLGERLRIWGWVGIAVSFVGATIIALGEGAGISGNLGTLLVLLAALLLSSYSIIQKPLLTRYRPVEVATYAIWAGTLALLPFGSGLPAAIAAAPFEATAAVIFLGIGPAALAYVAWAIALTRLPASRAASFLYLVPAVAILIAWFWLGEIPHTLALLGGSLAIGGVVIVGVLGKR
jgi:drug/metabolite transporter (DMT)-like permease